MRQPRQANANLGHPNLRSFALRLLHLALAAATVSAMPSYAHAAPTWPSHVQLGMTWIKQIQVGNNKYDSPANISYDANHVLHATSECGSFTAQLMLQGYPNLITPQMLNGLTGSPSPTASLWYDAIDPGLPHSAVNGISLIPIDHGIPLRDGRGLRYSNRGLLAVGDILAAKYNLTANAGGTSAQAVTGHVMTVQSLIAPVDDQTIVLTGTKAIPNVQQVKRWVVNIIDSNASVHGVTDSRYGKDAQEDDGNDHGIGRGTIYLYEDATRGSRTFGKLVGWTWSAVSSYTYQFSNPLAMDNKGKTTYRPMVIGRMSGGGL